VALFSYFLVDKFFWLVLEKSESFLQPTRTTRQENEVLKYCLHFHLFTLDGSLPRLHPDLKKINFPIHKND